MAYNDKKTKMIESKKTKAMRIWLAILYFIQVVLTTFPFTWIPDDKGNVKQYTAFEFMVRPSGYHSSQEIKLALLFGIFVIFPLVCFFFFVLSKGVVKNYVSFACSIICSVLLTFGIGGTIAMGGVVALLLYVFILFFTTQNLLMLLADNRTE
jgi:hypothetical protein